MSGSERERFIVRILDLNNNPVGAGFLISPRHVLTCSHVSSKLGKKITLDFRLISKEMGHRGNEWVKFRKKRLL